MTIHRPELELLLACARTPLQSGNTDAIRMQLSSPLDWNEVLRLARQHAVLPLLYHHLKTLGPQMLPQAAWNRLSNRFRANLSHNLFMTAELLKILRMLEAHGIAAIPYKGPALAAAVYGDVALRQFGDLDILVRQCDVLNVKALLLNHGYQPAFTLTPAQESAYLRSSCEYNFRNKTQGIHLDIHWRIVRPDFMFSLDIDRLWECLETVQLGGHPIPSLRPEELLLILCVHGGKHEWERIGWICDVVQLVHSRRDIQWQRLIEQATRLGVVRILRLGLFLAHDLLDATLPPDIATWVRVDGMANTLAAQVYDQLSQAPHSPNFTHHTFTLKMRERWRDRMAYSCRLPGALNVEDLTFFPLPSYLSGLYYGLRPIRLLGKYTARLLQR